MDNKETLTLQNKSDILLYDDSYFKYIFKKTEKIVSAVFYITRTEESISQKDAVIVDIEDSSRTLLETSIKALRATQSSRHTRLEDLRIALIALESKLIVGSAARVVSGEYLEVFRHEMVSVHRALREYLTERMRNPLQEPNAEGIPARVPRKITERKDGERQPREMNVVQHQGRRERILSIIKDKGEATIKDVSVLMTDFSEKTIQRELMSLIKDGVLIKEGERRWSRYRVA
jgi:DNA-binding transcriptional ArsR family regulator